MGILVALLPAIAWVAVVATIASIWPQWGWRRSLVRGAVATAAYMVLTTEILSWLRAISPASLTIVWLLPVLAALAWYVGARGRGRAFRRPSMEPLRDPWVLVEAGMVGLVLGLTAAVAWLAPPQAWDSLTYHMARVAHWAQNASIGHYVTGIARQNLMSPGAEIGMLQVYVLAQGDRLVNYVQWSAMVVCVIAAGLVAGELGAGRRTQAFAAVFVATLPMGIAQATSAMTDYVAALWMICVGYEAAGFLKGRMTADGYVFLGLTSGLAVLTKPTTVPYLLAFALTLAVAGLSRRGLRRFVLGVAVAAAMAIFLNLGYWSRNMSTYGNLLGPSQTTRTNGNEVLNARTLLSNLMRNASLQVATPWTSINQMLTKGIVTAHGWIGADPNDPRTSVHSGFAVVWSGQDELTSANQIQALLALVTFAVLAFLAVRDWSRVWLPASYALSVVLGFVAFGGFFKWTPNGSRYELLFFVLAAPVAAWVVGRVRKPWVGTALAAVMLLFSTPWLLEMNTRPLLAQPRVGSLLSEPRRSFYLAHAPALEPVYQDLVEAIESRGYRQVGVMLGGDAAEYPLFAFLGAPASGIRFEWIVSGDPSVKYRDPAFQPDAVVCDSSCPSEWTTAAGLPLLTTVKGYRLFGVQ